MLRICNVEIPEGIETDISDDINNALRISWKCGERQVELVIGDTTEEPNYIYFSSPNEYGVIPISPTAFQSKIIWLVESQLFELNGQSTS